MSRRGWWAFYGSSRAVFAPSRSRIPSRRPRPRPHPRAKTPSSCALGGVEGELESYGLVATAFCRFNDLQLQLGGSFGPHAYFAAQLSNGNPIFMRDANALAGDNGTDPPPNPDPNRNPGFPILYDAEVEELAGDGRMEWGGALGARFLSADQARGVDVIGYYYRTRLSAAAKRGARSTRATSTSWTAPAASRWRSTATSATGASSTSACA